MYGHISQVRENQKVLASEHKQILSNQKYLRKILAKLSGEPDKETP